MAKRDISIKEKQRNDDLKSRVSAKIRLERELAGYTRAEFAELVGCSVENINSIEFNKTMPSIYLLINICNLLGISLDWLFFEDASNDTDLTRIEEALKNLDKKNFQILEGIILKYLEGVYINRQKAVEQPDDQEKSSDS